MKMHVSDFSGQHVVNSLAQLEELLSTRFGGGFNSFQMGIAPYPSLLVLVRDNLAWMYYIPYEGHPGLVSQGSISDLKRGEQTQFFHPSVACVENVDNEQIIPITQATAAVREYFVTRELPSCVEWHDYLAALTHRAEKAEKNQP